MNNNEQPSFRKVSVLVRVKHSLSVIDVERLSEDTGPSHNSSAPEISGINNKPSLAQLKPNPPNSRSCRASCLQEPQIQAFVVNHVTTTIVVLLCHNRHPRQSTLR